MTDTTAGHAAEATTRDQRRSMLDAGSTRDAPRRGKRQKGQAACVLDLAAFRGLISSLADKWTQQGVEHSVHASPDDGRPKASSWVRIEVGEYVGGLIVWDSGEGELDFPRPDGDVYKKHYDGLTDETMRQALDDLQEFIDEAAPWR